MKNSFFTINCLFMLLLFAVLAGCSTHSKQSNSSAGEAAEPAKKLVHSSSDQMKTIRTRGTLRVGVSIFVPWVMHDNSGELIGYEIDVARKLAEDMGVKVEFVETSWPSIITDLLADRYDIIISGLSVTPQRALLINFSEPYSHSSSVLIANRKLAGRMKNNKQFNSSKTSIGVVRNSIGEKQIGQEFPKATLKTFDSESQAIAALLAGKIHAMMSSTPRTGYLLNRHAQEVFQPFSKPFSVHAEGFGIRKGDADFLNYLNTWILHNTGNGWLPQHHHYWFDTIDWAGQLQAASNQ
jgi:polar amino acid transport system substrate-binding protein